ncbi:MAG TPA: patatin-like phospholipase family protein [Acidimicrobiia bacterium]|nr:patatin-like phospholipase family protein [Acidimicrobiia bacterium]
MLGAGGVAGHAFHAGVLRALAEETGWDARDADLVIGTSAGSVVGLGIRIGLSSSDLFARVVDKPLSSEGAALLADLPPATGGAWWRTDGAWRLPLPASPGLVARVATRPWRARPGVLLAGLLPAGRLDASRIARDADALVASTRREVKDLWVTAVRLSDGRRVAFGRDGEPLPEAWTWGQAVAASCAIPGFFTPVVIGGERYVDGGAHSPTNAHLAGAVEPDVVVVSSPMSSIRTARHRSLDAPVRTAYRLRLAAEVAQLRRRGVPVIVFQPPPSVLRAAGLNAMNPDVRIPVAEASYAAAAARCAAASFPTSLVG